MRVRMLETKEAAPDGIHVVKLETGSDYELPDDLARRYLARGVGVAADAKPKTRSRSPK